MIKLGLKNYLLNLKYFFTPLGAFFLGVVIGFSILIPGTISIINNLGTDAGEILNNTNLNFNAFESSLVNSFSSLDWNNIDGAVKSLLDYNWLSKTLNNALYALAGDYSTSASEISNLIDGAISDFLPLFVWLFFFSILGVFAGFMLTRLLVRKEIAERTFRKMFLQIFLDSVVSVTLISFVLWLIAIWQPSVYISAIVSVIVYGFVALFEAYVTHAKKTMKFKNIVNFKNVVELAASNFIILLIGLAFVSLVSILINDFVGIFVGISFLEISFVVISLNAEVYVKEIADAKGIKRK